MGDRDPSESPAAIIGMRRCLHLWLVKTPYTAETLAILSFLKTYSAALADPRQTTRATVSVVGPGGKIATVASADMHKLNVGAAVPKRTS